MVTQPDSFSDSALLEGRILSAATNKPLDGTFTIRTDLGDVPVRTLEDGTFVFFGDQKKWFPTLDTENYSFRLYATINAAEFWTDEKPLVVDITVPSGTTFPPPFSVGDQLMKPDPVNIRGLVVRARQPSAPISGATVTIASDWGSQSSLTGGDGRYRLDNLDVGPSAEIRVSAPGFVSQVHPLTLNYRERINIVNFRLVT